MMQCDAPLSSCRRHSGSRHALVHTPKGGNSHRGCPPPPRPNQCSAPSNRPCLPALAKSRLARLALKSGPPLPNKQRSLQTRAIFPVGQSTPGHQATRAPAAGRAFVVSTCAPPAVPAAEPASAVPATVPSDESRPARFAPPRPYSCFALFAPVAPAPPRAPAPAPRGSRCRPAQSVPPQQKRQNPPPARRIAGAAARARCAARRKPFFCGHAIPWRAAALTRKPRAPALLSASKNVTGQAGWKGTQLQLEGSSVAGGSRQ